MAAALYVEDGRKMRAVDEKGGDKYITIGEPALMKDGSQVATNVFDGKYRCVVDVGPSSRTRRDATVRSLVGMAEVASQAGDQELAAACITAALAEMDGEGISDLKKWVRMRGVRMGILQPTDEEKQELAQEAQNQPQDPNAMLAQGMTQQALAEADKAKAGTVKTLADAELVRAKIQETLAGISIDQRQQIIDAVQADADRLVQHAGNMANGAVQ
jgi:hypothetical protein